MPLFDQAVSGWKVSKGEESSSVGEEVVAFILFPQYEQNFVSSDNSAPHFGTSGDAELTTPVKGNQIEAQRKNSIWSGGARERADNVFFCCRHKKRAQVIASSLAPGSDWVFYSENLHLSALEAVQKRHLLISDLPCTAMGGWEVAAGAMSPDTPLRYLLL